jgi:flagellin-like protein
MVATQCQRGSWVDADACRFRCPPLSCHVSALYLYGDVAATLDSGRRYKDVRCPNSDPKGQRGITGLETASVLIAFVVVSSVFAFAALSSELLSSDSAKGSFLAGLSGARVTLSPRGNAIAKDTDTDGRVDKLYFQVANAAGGAAIDLTPGNTILRYSDARQSKPFDTSTMFSVSPQGTTDDDNLLEPGETYEMTLLNLETNLMVAPRRAPRSPLRF